MTTITEKLTPVKVQTICKANIFMNFVFSTVTHTDFIVYAY